MIIKHLFFDLDHTLWDFEKNSANSFEVIFRKNSININLNIFLKHYKPINKYYWKLYREERVTKDELRYARFKEAFDAIEYSITDEMIHNLSEDYINELPNHNELFTDTKSVLNFLKEKYRLHIITNGFNEIQYRKIINSGIKSYFDQIITSDSVNVKKPNPLIFNHALKIAGASVDESVMIGDSYEADILGALNVGMQAIYCNFENEPIFDDDIKMIKELSELKQIL